MKNPHGKAHRLISVMCEQLNSSLKMSWNWKKSALITEFNRTKMRGECLKWYHTFKSHLFNTNTHFTVFPLNHCLLIFNNHLIMIHILSKQGNTKLPVKIPKTIVLLS